MRNTDAERRVMRYAEDHEGEQLASVVVARVLDLPRGTVGSVFHRMASKSGSRIKPVATGVYCYGSLGQYPNGHPLAAASAPKPEPPAAHQPELPAEPIAAPKAVTPEEDLLLVTVTGRTASGKLLGRDELSRTWVCLSQPD